MRCGGPWCRSVSIVAVTAALYGDLGAQPSTTPSNTLAVSLDTDNAAMRSRGERAARASFDAYSVWLGPRDLPPLTITGVPWRSSPETMDVESLVAYEAARLWWRDRAGEPPAVNGIAWYLQSRVVERLYDLTFERPGHSSESVRFFGGSLSWAFPTVRLSRWNAGLARGEWRSTRDWPRSGRRLPASLTPEALDVAMALAAFEQTAGWPTLQAALFGAAHSRATTLTEALNAAAGTSILPPRRAGDPSLSDVRDAACGDRPCRVTRVTVTGDDALAGTVVRLRVEFADGQTVEALIDAGAAKHEVTFESATPYTAVSLDPDRHLPADRNLLNNTRLASPSSNMPVAKWAARWLAWVEDAMLSYSALF